MLQCAAFLRIFQCILRISCTLNLMPFVHLFCALLSYVLLPFCAFLCNLTHLISFFASLLSLRTIAHLLPFRSFLWVVMPSFASLCLFAHLAHPYGHPSAFLSLSLYLYPFSDSLFTSLDPSDHPCASFGLSRFFCLPTYLMHLYSTSPLDARPYAPPCILMPLFLCILLLSLYI